MNRKKRCYQTGIEANNWYRGNGDSGVLSVTPLLMAGHLRGVPAP